MSHIAIQFEKVGKLYRLGTVGTGTLSHDLNRWWKTRVLHQEDPYLKIGETNDRSHRGHSDYVWALKDISFSVEKGDVVGIIGKNGAGKSTLLKLLSQITSPTTGVIRARGRIGSLLEVGTGFHPEMTGRENIYMNGSIMGMTQAEITRKLDEIIDFAGVARYIDTPVKRYSSGMTVRLGFAVAAFMEPEILVVDEVLAVGDAEFQRKAIGKMQDVSRGEGRTVLFVSHNMAAIRSLCHKGIVLKDGIMDFSGTAEEAIDRYLKETPLQDNKRIIDYINKHKDYLSISEIRINDTPSNTTTLQPGQQFLPIYIKGTTREPMKCEVKLIIKKLDGTPMASLVEGRYKGRLYDIGVGEFIIEKRIRLPRYMANGDYILDLDLHQPTFQDYFQARHCQTLHIEGFYDQYSLPLYLSYEGFIGLESEPINNE
jgi:lipopolysaccharide transport system ATP-binding protein